MALSSIIRRGSATIFPVAIRSVASGRAFHGAISVVCNGHSDEVGGQFRQLFRFSTAVAAFEKLPTDGDDDTLVCALDSLIDSEKKPRDVRDIPDDFPFEMEHDDGSKSDISLRRKYQDEIITVRVSKPYNPKAEVLTLLMSVNISKGNNGGLSFNVTASPHEIAINRVSIKDSYYSHNCSYHCVERDTDETLQKALKEYLEIRGIKLSMTKILLEYMENEVKNEDTKKHLIFLKEMKDFIEN